MQWYGPGGVRRLAFANADRPILDEDVATDEFVTEDPDVVPEEADLDRTSEVVGELSSDPAESAEEAAVHVERE